MVKRHAKGTTVTAKETIALTEAMIIGSGGSRFQHIVDNVRGRRIFLLDPVHGLLTISFGFDISNADEREVWRRYRCASTSIKGRLISIVEGIESPAEAFNAHILLDEDEGTTLFDKTKHLLPMRRPNQEGIA
jgi:hypothetical protein